MTILHAWKEERVVVHIVVCVTMLFQNGGRGWRHRGNSWGKGHLQRRCKILAHIAREMDVLFPNVGHFIQLIIPSTWGKRIERLAKLEPKIPSLMWEHMFHMKKIFSSKSRHGSGLVRSGLTSWHNKTYTHLYICKFQLCMHVFCCNITFVWAT